MYYIHFQAGKSISKTLQRLLKKGISKISTSAIKKLSKNPKIKSIIKIGAKTLQQNPKLKRSLQKSAKTVLKNLVSSTPTLKPIINEVKPRILPKKVVKSKVQPFTKKVISTQNNKNKVVKSRKKSQKVI